MEVLSSQLVAVVVLALVLVCTQGTEEYPCTNVTDPTNGTGGEALLYLYSMIIQHINYNNMGKVYSYN